jgi:prevent-host-death family protein
VLVARISKAVSLAELREDSAGVVRRVRDSKRPVIVTDRGRARAVLLSVEAYEHAEREREILRELVRGEREIAAGRSFSLDEVLADADKVLGRARK